MAYLGAIVALIIFIAAYLYCDRLLKGGGE